MSFRNRQHSKMLQKQQPQNFNQQIGLLDEMVGLNFIREPSKNQHKYKYQLNYFHPLKIFDKLTHIRKKQAFQIIFNLVFNERIQQKNVYIPEELLKGNIQIMSKYKQMIRKSRLNSYLKLNIRHTSVSRQKKQSSMTLSNSKKSQIDMFSQKFISSQLLPYDSVNHYSNSNNNNANIIENNVNKDININKNLSQNHTNVIQNNTIQHSTNIHEEDSNKITINIIQSKVKQKKQQQQKKSIKSIEQKQYKKNNNIKLISTQMALSKNTKSKKVDQSSKNSSIIDKKSNLNINFSTIKKTKQIPRKNSQQAINISYSVLDKNAMNLLSSSNYLYQQNHLKKSRTKSVRQPGEFYQFKTHTGYDNQQEILNNHINIRSNSVKGKKTIKVKQKQYMNKNYVSSQRNSLNNQQRKNNQFQIINDDYFFIENNKMDLHLNKKGKRAIYIKHDTQNY